MGRINRLVFALLFLSSMALLASVAANGVVRVPSPSSSSIQGRERAYSLIIPVITMAGIAVTVSSFIALVRRAELLKGLPAKRRKRPILSWLLWALAIVGVVYVLIRKPPKAVVVDVPSNATSPPYTPTGLTSPFNQSGFEVGGGPVSAVRTWAPLLIALPLAAALLLLALRSFPQEEVSSRPIVARTPPQLGPWKVSGPTRDMIVKIYRNAIFLLSLGGFPYEESWTAREHEREVTNSLPGVASDFSSLTGLFEVAKYSRRRVHHRDVERAHSAYAEIARGVPSEGRRSP